MLASFILGVFASLLIGCEGDLIDRDKALPAPLPAKLPYEFHGKLYRVWGGDYFDMRKDGMLRYVCLQGIDTPKPGQPFYNKARDELREIVGGRELRVVVTHLDDSKVAFAKAWLPTAPQEAAELDVGLELLKRGFGWYDGNEFEGDEEYQLAEANARRAKLGLWSQPDPVPPWNFNATK